MFAETERKFARTGANVLTISEILGRPKISFYTIYMFYTAQQTSVHSVCSVVKNDSEADLPHRRGGEGEENSHGMPKFFRVAILTCVMQFGIIFGVERILEASYGTF